MTKKHLPILLIILGITTTFGFQLAPSTLDDTFTIYLVRHSEKDTTGNHSSDPPLTACGEARSAHLATFLDAIELDAVYSTDYKRTQSTALPTAQSKALDIQDYDPRQLEAFSKLLMERGEDVLVVGHSNTTGVLAGILANEEIGAFDESIYNRVYQVVVQEKIGRLHLFHTAFSCDE